MAELLVGEAEVDFWSKLSRSFYANDQEIWTHFVGRSCQNDITNIPGIPGRTVLIAGSHSKSYSVPRNWDQKS